MRRNGFSRPLDPLQVASWLLFVGIIASLYILYTPVATPRAVGITFSVFYALPALATGMTAFHVQLIDPVAETDPQGEQRFCNICERWVKHRSRHCSSCRKCVERYDHHCPWVNNCIGVANYRVFIGMMCSLLTFVTLHLALLLHVGIQLLIDPSYDGAFGRQLAASGLGLNVTGYGIIIAMLAALLALVWQQICWLLSLHYMLHLKGYTTDEYFAQVWRKNEPQPWPCLLLCRRLCHNITEPLCRACHPHPPSRKVGAAPYSAEQVPRPAE
jgi:hypothetical protein